MQISPQAAGGVVGYNYVTSEQLKAGHRAHPDWKIYGSETASSVNSRGIYNRTTDSGKTADKQLTSYDGSAVGWGKRASDAWYTTIINDFVAGEYVWTGFDYIGEPTHWNGIGCGGCRKLAVTEEQLLWYYRYGGIPEGFLLSVSESVERFQTHLTRTSGME